MPQPLKFAVIGSGVIAPTHLTALQGLEDIEVAWVCDLVEERAAKVAEKYGIPNVTTDYREVLADGDVDAICVCTDHGSHAPITIAGLEAGKHVLCEKALAADLAGVQQIMDAAAEHPEQVCGAVFQHRFDPVNRALKQLLEGGAFGQMLTAGVHVRCLRTENYYRADEWRGTWAQEGGAVLINQAIHFIDLLAWVTGGVRSLCGTYENMTHGDAIETEDTAVASLKFKGGGLGVLEATCSSHIGWEYTLAIHGTEGSVELRNDNMLKVNFKDEERQAEVESALGKESGPQAAAHIPSHYGTGHAGQLADFVDAIREKRKPFVTVGSAAHTVRIVMSIYESHRTGGWVDIEKPKNVGSAL